MGSKKSPFAASAIELIASYFEPKWYGRSAAEAFELAQELAANLFPQNGVQILSVSFQQFKKAALAADVQPSTVRSLKK